MRANRKFVWDEEAVSPVIAVILMVAITVVLAATVFVLVSDIGSQSGQTAPTFNPQQNEATDTLTIVSKGQGANWQRIELRHSATTPATDQVFAKLDSASGTDVATLTLSATAFTPVTATSTPMEAGDELCFRASTQQTNIKIEMRDSVASSTIGSGWTFSSLATAFQC